jgi:hypothetical protein
MRKWIRYSVVVATAVCAACSGGGGDGGSGTGAPEPPEITSGPSVTNVSVSGATISWRTDKNCDSKVLYGETTSYGDSVMSAVMTSDHSLALTGLDHTTPYHYRVSSEDAEGLSVRSGDNTFATLSPVPGLVGEGWDFFESGEFDLAVARFDSALALEPDDVGALEGLGWAYLYLYEFEECLAALESALSADPDRLDCLVATAFLYGATEQYGSAIDAARAAIDAGGATYVFAHDADITTSDVRYCLVTSLVGAGDLAGALSEVLVLDPSVDLDPEDATTWDGHSSFEEALLVIIEELKDQV